MWFNHYIQNMKDFRPSSSYHHQQPVSYIKEPVRCCLGKSLESISQALELAYETLAQRASLHRTTIADSELSLSCDVLRLMLSPLVRSPALFNRFIFFDTTSGPASSYTVISSSIHCKQYFPHQIEVSDVN